MWANQVCFTHRTYFCKKQAISETEFRINLDGMQSCSTDYLKISNV